MDGLAGVRHSGIAAGRRRPWDKKMDQRPHIVVVEDEAMQRQLLADFLGRQNYRVSTAEDGGMLHEIVERDPPSLVLLDVGLPGEDGFALARWLRARLAP